MADSIFDNKTIPKIKSKEDLVTLIEKSGIPFNKVKRKIDYSIELEKLQLELLKLQNYIIKKQLRVVILFEGRDAAGKGGTIRRFKRYLNPRNARVIALGKPTDVEKGQWYFRRHVKELSNPGEIVFFDRSWYNRAVVEPVMKFCTKKQYHQFMQQVPEFEHMLYEDGVIIIKFWFSITKEEQKKRFDARKTNPLKQWKLSPVDLKSRSLWDEYTWYIREMFANTHTEYCPWTLINTDDKRTARLESIRHVLSKFNYNGKIGTPVNIYPDPSVVKRFHRSMFDQV